MIKEKKLFLFIGPSTVLILLLSIIVLYTRDSTILSNEQLLNETRAQLSNGNLSISVDTDRTKYVRGEPISISGTISGERSLTNESKIELQVYPYSNLSLPVYKASLYTKYGSYNYSGLD